MRLYSDTFPVPYTLDLLLEYLPFANDAGSVGIIWLYFRWFLVTDWLYNKVSDAPAIL